MIPRKFLPALVLACLASTGLGAETITNKIYSEKGLAGKQVITRKSDTEYSGQLDLGWNNRVVKIEESVRVNEDGMPVRFEASGLSAFGAPIEERFEWENGVASWESNRDDGSVTGEADRFYVPADSAGATDTLMVRALKATETKTIDLYPSGTARLQELRTVTLTRDNESRDVTLTAISGMNFSPSFAWYDEDGNLFAQNIGGWMRVIRDGWTLEDFDQLKQMQDAAEQDYLEEVARRYSHDYASMLIRSVNVVDIENGKILRETDVLLENGLIAAIGENLSADSGAEIVDGNGKTLIPGLWDMHGHLSKNDGLLNIAAGVTSVRDIGNDHDNILEIERLFNNNKVIGNRVYRSGFMDKMSQYSAGLSVESIEEAHRKVDWFADNGYLQLKLYSSIDPTWVKPLAEHAHRRGMRVSGHVPAFMTAEQAIDAGYDEIQHINMLFLNFLAGTEVDTRQQLRFSLIGEQAGALDLDSPEFSAFLAKLAEKKIVVDPTVATFRSMLLGKNKEIDPEFASIADHLPPAVVRNLKGATMDVADDEIDDYQAGADALVTLVGKLYERGIPIVPGTDHIAGFTLHRELELYSQAGIPNISVLGIATLQSAKLVGAAYRSGSISVGKDADVLLIDGDPTRDMSDIRKVALVVKGRNYYNPSELYPVLGVKPFVPAALPGRR